jgi:hypothetical protein
MSGCLSSLPLLIIGHFADTIASEARYFQSIFNT